MASTNQSRMTACPDTFVFFDFDRTLSQLHVFKILSGWCKEERPEGEVGRMEAPYALTERGQVRRLCELGPQWTKRAFGGDARIDQLRHLLAGLRGARLIIVSRGYVGVVRKCLEDVGLLEFFERVHGNLGEAYGKGTDFDFESNFFDLGLDVARFLGQPEEGLSGSKRSVVAKYVCDGRAPAGQALFIDDDINELRELQGWIPVIHVEGDGISTQEIKKIHEQFEKLQLQCFTPPAAEIPDVKQLRSRWIRLCVCVDDGDQDTDRRRDLDSRVRSTLGMDELKKVGMDELNKVSKRQQLRSAFAIICGRWNTKASRDSARPVHVKSRPSRQ